MIAVKISMKRYLLLFIYFCIAHWSLPAQENNFVFHTVQPSETLYAISRNYQVTVEDLKRWNKLPTNNISIGQKLIVGFDSKVDQKDSSVPDSYPEKVEHGTYHLVQPKETLYSISIKYKVNLDDVKKWNHLYASTLQVGQKLIIGEQTLTNKSKKVESGGFTEPQKPDEGIIQEKKVEQSEKVNTAENKTLAYNQAIEKADDAYLKEDYNTALSYYRQAHEISLEIDYPKQAMEEINMILAAKAEEKKFIAAPSGNKVEKNSVEEKSGMPENDSATEDKTLAYQQAIGKADNAYLNEDYNTAMSYYRQAHEISPEINYPKQTMEEINMILAAKTEEKKQSYSMRQESEKEIRGKSNETAVKADVATGNKSKPDTGVSAFTYYALIKSKPSDFSEILIYLPEDTKVELLDFDKTMKNYFQVRYKEYDGWIPSRNVKNTDEVQAFKKSLSNK